jgi:hypothetical protein
MLQLVIASEAKQSSLRLRRIRSGLLRRFAPRNDGENSVPMLSPSSWPGIAVRRTASLPLACDPRIHVFRALGKTWMAGSSPAMMRCWVNVIPGRREGGEPGICCGVAVPIGAPRREIPDRRFAPFGMTV